MGWRHENRMDKLSYKLDLVARHWARHDKETQPLADWVRNQMDSPPRPEEDD